MPNYRRMYVPGGRYFLTLVTFHRAPIFASPENVARLRSALSTVKKEQPFEFSAGVVLPDHAHFLWSLPPGDTAFSRRVGRLKVLFTRAVRESETSLRSVVTSRQKHRESDVWHRRFWEHTIMSEDDFERHLNYIHYNPIKHRLVACPHLWPYSSFSRWVERGTYEREWGCSCRGRSPVLPAMPLFNDQMGE